MAPLVCVTRLWPQPKLHHKGHKDFSPACGGAGFVRFVAFVVKKNLRGCDSFSEVIL